MIACMGGWCKRRNECANFHRRYGIVAERLCPKGNDEPTPLAEVRKAKWITGASEKQAQQMESKWQNTAQA